MLLVLSGNVQPNPSPDGGSEVFNTPADFKCLTGLGVLHINVQSLLAK